MDDALISETLEALATVEVARKAGRQVNTLRGIRGTPLAEVARVAAAVWADDRRCTPDDTDALRRLFSAAWEDGLVAIGLAAAMVPDAPDVCLQLGLDWLDQVDDTATADALGWLLLGQAFLATGASVERLDALLADAAPAHPASRRAWVALGLACLPLRLEGAAAAPLRERHGGRDIQFVEQPLSPLVHLLGLRFVRDEHPTVRKALRRLLRVWVRADPQAVVAWEGAVRGGLPKFLSAETKRARGRVAR